MFLLEESIKLLWKLVKEGRANKEHTNKQKHEFLKVASKAIRRTLSYIRDENKRDTKTEEELSELWANVALAARPFDSNLAERCYLKGNYWANPNNWSDEEVRNAGIEIERIEIEIRNHFKGEARANTSKQQKTIEKRSRLLDNKLTNLKRNNQEQLSKIIKALKELKEALTEENNSTRIQKAREAVKSAMSPLKETYDFLHQSIRANCNSCTEECMDNIKHALRDYKKGYPALWDSLAKQEFIDELNVAKKGTNTKNEGEGTNVVRKQWHKKVWAIIIAIIIILGGIWTVIQIRESETFKNLFRDSKGDVYVKKSESLLYRELSPQIKVELISLLQNLRQQYNHINIKISVTSDKGSRVRHRVAEEIAGILASAGFEAKAVLPLVRFSNDTSDVVIKGNEIDIELLTQLSKILRRFIKTNTPFSGMKNENFQKGELQIIIAGDPLFSSDGIVTFQ